MFPDAMQVSSGDLPVDAFPPPILVSTLFHCRFQLDDHIHTLKQCIAALNAVKEKDKQPL